jgi:hypothetical protein
MEIARNYWYGYCNQITGGVTSLDYTVTPPVFCTFAPSGKEVTDAMTMWVGNGTPSPCVAEAKKKKKNPSRYCRSVGSQMYLGDGSCLLWDQCFVMTSEEVCKRGRWCEWRNMMCQMRREMVPRPGLSG